MEHGSLFQQIMDNWTLVYLFTAFVVICLFVLLGRPQSYRDTARSIFRNEDKPAATPGHEGAHDGEEART